MLDEDLAREHAAASYADPANFQERGPRTEAYVRTALGELERLQAEGPGIIAALLDGGSHIAKQLNADAFQGFREIVQNADDLGATTVRFGVRGLEGMRQLLVVHDGAPVELMHVLPMVYPAISTRRQQAKAKGRFGVGLKTLTRLGANLTVHSAPYHFTSRDNLAVRAQPTASIPGFYTAETDTLLTLNLDAEVEEDFVSKVFENWAPEDIVFLDTVRSVSVFDLDADELAFHFEVQEQASAEGFELNLLSTPVPVEASRFKLGDRDWVRYSVDVAVPNGLARTSKATADGTRLSLAVPLEGEAKGWVHVALPTRISTGASFSLDAQFNPATSREDLSKDRWNLWLADVATEFCGALAIHLARMNSPLVWSVVPVGAKTNSTSTWLNAHFAAGWMKAVETFSNEPRLIGSDPSRSLAQVAYGDGLVDDLLDDADYVDVGGASPLPVSLRDAEGRWRSILDRIGLSKEITASSLMRACNRPLNHRNPDWFLELARRCVSAGQSDLIFEGAWLPLLSGGRAQPQYQFDAKELLVLEPPEVGLATRHGLCRSAHPFLSDQDNEDLKKVLQDEGNLLQKADAHSIINAFTARYADDPLRISREDLAALRDLFGELTDREADDLGPVVGNAILLEAFRYQKEARGGARQVRLEARPGDVYLPSAIEDEADGWSRAAGHTENLLWASNAYVDVFKLAARKGPGAGSMRRMRGAKRFLLLLGTHVAPRLEEVDTPITPGMHAAQWAARRAVGRGEGILRNDLISPDLERVLADIISPGAVSSRRIPGQRRKSGLTADRAVALYRSLATHWSSYEDRRTTWARRATGYGGNLAQVPATWILRLASLPWMRNEVGHPCTPQALAIATRITQAIETDPQRFAAGLTVQDAASPLAKALGITVDPPASELVAALERHRDDPSQRDIASVLRLYQALSGHCPQTPSTPAPEARVGDMTVSSLKAKFGIKRSGRGLIFGRVTTTGSDDWLAPTAVFLGKDIFHGRRPFVLSDKALQPLWNALNISTPRISACVRELQDIAGSAPVPDRDAILIDIYRHLDRLLERPTPAERRELEATPLLVDGAWLTRRPIFLPDHHGIKTGKFHLWSPPCAPHSIRRFVDAVGVKPLRVDDRPASEIFGNPEELQTRFQSALRILQADLARDDERSYRALEPWSRINTLTLNVHGEDCLAVNVRDEHGRARPALVRDHTDVSGGAIHVDREEAIGRVEYGGHAMARFATPDRRREIALAWGAAWATSADIEQLYVIELADEAVDQSVDELANRHDSLKARPRRRIQAGERESVIGTATLPKIEVRLLKDLPEEFAFSVDLRTANGDAPKGMQVRKSVALRSGPRQPVTTSPAAKRPAPVTAHRRYDQTQLQQKGWAYVASALEEGIIPVTDLQKERGVGADGTINWKTFIEMKSVGREMPAGVTLTSKEFQRAREAKGDFLLVVVSGLEEGFDTLLHVYADPVNTLPWSTTGSVSVSGLAAGRALIIRQSGNGEIGTDMAQ